METDNPHIEIKPGLDLLGPILDKYIFPFYGSNWVRFVSVTDLYVPLEDGTKDHCYISKSYDATSHFETTTDDVKDIYSRIMGKPLIIKEKMRPTQVTFGKSCLLMSLGGGAEFVCRLKEMKQTCGFSCMKRLKLS